MGLLVRRGVRIDIDQFIHSDSAQTKNIKMRTQMTITLAHARTQTPASRLAVVVYCRHTQTCQTARGIGLNLRRSGLINSPEYLLRGFSCFVAHLLNVIVLFLVSMTAFGRFECVLIEEMCLLWLAQPLDCCNEVLDSSARPGFGAERAGAIVGRDRARSAAVSQR